MNAYQRKRKQQIVRVTNAETRRFIDIHNKPILRNRQLNHVSGKRTDPSYKKEAQLYILYERKQTLI